MTTIRTSHGHQITLGDPASKDTWLSGAPMDPRMYDVRRAPLWAALAKAADAGFPGGVPTAHPQATPSPCIGDCGVQVAVNPNQSPLLSEPDVAAICYLCLAEALQGRMPSGMS